MKLKSNVFIAVLICASIIITGCGPVTLQLKYEALKAGENLLSSVPARKIKLVDFQDSRAEDAEPTLVGGRHTGTGSPLYDVKSERPVYEIVRDAIASELQRSGHSVVDREEDVVIQGEIKTFWVQSDATPEYWNVNGRVKLLIEVVDPADGKSIFTGIYSDEEHERRFVQPHDDVMDRVLLVALRKVMKQVRTDTELVSALKKM